MAQTIGRDLASARAKVLDRGVTINGLVILNTAPEQYVDYLGREDHRDPAGGLANYYRTHVIGGPGSFLMQADDFTSFGEAIVKKLVVEIAGKPASTMTLAHGILEPGQAPAFDDERMAQTWNNTP